MKKELVYNRKIRSGFKKQYQNQQKSNKSTLTCICEYTKNKTNKQKRQDKRINKYNLHPKDLEACLAVEFIITSTGGKQHGNF